MLCWRQDINLMRSPSLDSANCEYWKHHKHETPEQNMNSKDSTVVRGCPVMENSTDQCLTTVLTVFCALSWFNLKAPPPVDLYLCSCALGLIPLSVAVMLRQQMFPVCCSVLFPVYHIVWEPSCFNVSLLHSETWCWLCNPLQSEYWNLWDNSGPEKLIISNLMIHFHDSPLLSLWESDVSE